MYRSLITHEGRSFLIAGLGSLDFACFTWGTIRHFARQGSGSGGAWAISLFSLGGFGLFIWRTVALPPSEAWPLAMGLFVLSTLLWAWAVRATRAARPTVAFTDDAPTFLLDKGPYRMMRHPFYSAYMLFWFGTSLASPRLAAWLVVLAIGMIYWMAARHEEGKFARSAMSARYTLYAERTGRFMPRLWHHSSASRT